MSRADPVNFAASVRQRLLNLSRTTGRQFQAILEDFARERFLHRLQQSQHADSLVLKGAALFRVWDVVPHRITRDADFLKYGDDSISSVERLVRDVAATQPVVPDGLVFHSTSLRVEAIREANSYGGLRARFTMELAGARIPMQLDFGFGDVVVPDAVEVEYPTLLAFPAPVIRAYPREAVVAEKFETMVSLGERNTRLKDFYDLWFLAARFPFDCAMLSAAIVATFEGRNTSLPEELPVVLSAAHAESPEVVRQWQAFVGRSSLEAAAVPSFGDAVALCRSFLVPLAQAVARREDFAGTWPPGGPWETDGGDNQGKAV